MGYCIRQTDWESPNSRAAAALAGQLHIDHGPAVQALIEDATERSLIKQWLDGEASSPAGLFLLQNKRVLALLKDTSGFAAFEAVLSVELPGVNPDFVFSKSTSVSLCPPSLEPFDHNDWLPMYLQVSAVRGKEDVYELYLTYDRKRANPLQVHELEIIASRVHPKLATQMSVKVETQLDGRPAVVVAVKRWYDHLESASRWVPPTAR